MSRKQQSQHGFKQYKLIIITAVIVCVLCMIFIGMKVLRASGQTLTNTQQSAIPAIVFENETDIGANVDKSPDLNSEDESREGKININFASKEELIALKGIGEVKAESIVEYRRENGKFQSIYEIMKVSGIG